MTVDELQEWVPHLGTVELEVTIGGVARVVATNQLHATLLLHFQDKRECAVGCTAECTYPHVSI